MQGEILAARALALAYTVVAFTPDQVVPGVREDDKWKLLADKPLLLTTHAKAHWSQSAGSTSLGSAYAAIVDGAPPLSGFDDLDAKNDRKALKALWVLLTAPIPVVPVGTAQPATLAALDALLRSDTKRLTPVEFVRLAFVLNQFYVVVVNGGKGLNFGFPGSSNAPAVEPVVPEEEEEEEAQTASEGGEEEEAEEEEVEEEEAEEEEEEPDDAAATAAAAAAAAKAKTDADAAAAVAKKAAEDAEFLVAAAEVTAAAATQASKHAADAAASAALAKTHAQQAHADASEVSEASEATKKEAADADAAAAEASRLAAEAAEAAALASKLATDAAAAAKTASDVEAAKAAKQNARNALAAAFAARTAAKNAASAAAAAAEAAKAAKEKAAREKAGRKSKPCFNEWLPDDPLEELKPDVMLKRLMQELIGAADDDDETGIKWPRARDLYDYLVTLRPPKLDEQWLSVENEAQRKLRLKIALQRTVRENENTDKVVAKSAAWLLEILRQPPQTASVLDAAWRDAPTAAEAVRMMVDALTSLIDPTMPPQQMKNLMAIRSQLNSGAGLPVPVPAPRAGGGGGRPGILYTMSSYENWVGRPAPVAPGAFAKLRYAHPDEIRFAYNALRGVGVGGGVGGA